MERVWGFNRSFEDHKSKKDDVLYNKILSLQKNQNRSMLLNAEKNGLKQDL